MSQQSVDAVVVEHIDELETALRHCVQTIDPRLGKEMAQALEAARIDGGWTGEIEDDLDELSWMAAEEWRTADDTEDSFDLYFHFDSLPSMDGREPTTWVGSVAGYANAQIIFRFNTDALDRTEWKSLLRNEAELIESLVAHGFRCVAGDRLLGMRIQIDRSALARAFEDDDFSEALLPVASAVSRIKAAKKELDLLVAAIRRIATDDRPSRRKARVKLIK